jgi:acyl carrier protein
MNIQIAVVGESPGVSSSTADAVRDVAVAVLGLEIHATQIQDNSNLFELGADSMSIVELLFQLEDRFGLKFDESEFNVDIFKRFADLVVFVDDQIKGQPQ